MLTAAKPRKCKVNTCRASFTPTRSFQVWCSGDCAVVIARARREKAEVEKVKRERKETRQKLDKLKTIPALMADLKTVLHRYIRTRDEGMPCICCGQPFEPQRFGGSVDAGHYVSVGSNPSLRFEPLNIHAQRKNCNRPSGTTRDKFRAGMVARVGLKAVEWLEGPHPPRKWTRDELLEMRAKFASMTRDLERSRK